MDELFQLIAELEQECADLQDYIAYIHEKADSDILENYFQGVKRDARLLHNKLQTAKNIANRIVTQQNGG